MGQIFSTLLHTNVFAEIFIISYMTRRGVTPYTLELIPGGHLPSNADDAIIRHKFKMALRRQRLLERALREVQQNGLPTRCMSPCLIREFNEIRERNGGYVDAFRWKDENRSGFGTLGKLVSDQGMGKQSSLQLGGVGVSSEIVVAYDVVKDAQKAEPLRGSQREKRSRSRPEPRQRRNAKGQRQSMSVTQVMKEPLPRNLPPLRSSPSYVVVERIQLSSAKKARKAWPPKENVHSALRDPKNRPTSYFLARFRIDGASEGDYVDVDYRFNKHTQKDLFQVTNGSLEKLLSGLALQCVMKDWENNNEVDEKTIFFQNFPEMFNRLDCRIWWNGYIACVEGDKASRMQLKTVTMDPPSFVFDMKGLRHISATRNDTRFSFVGNNEEDEEHQVGGDRERIHRSFILRGRTEHDLKQLEIKHEDRTTFVSIVLPTLSGIPVSTKSSGSKMDTNSRSQVKIVDA